MHDILINLDKFLTHSSLWGIPASFVGGVLVSVSPCVLPLIPLTFGIISQVSLQTKIKPLFLSLIFVGGITLTYIAFGIIAAIFGIFMENFINPRLIYGIVGVVFILLGISFFDIFHFPFLNFSYEPRLTVISVFVLGIISGFTMLPCAFPILGTILGLISLRHNIGYAVLTLIFFSLGYAVVFVAIGDSAAFIKKFTAKGKWLIMIRRILGIVIAAVGIYFLKHLISF